MTNLRMLTMILSGEYLGGFSISGAPCARRILAVPTTPNSAYDCPGPSRCAGRAGGGNELVNRRLCILHCWWMKSCATLRLAVPKVLRITV